MPILLDLFCGAGGAAMGYHRAGFEVIGVDIDPQPAWPATMQFYLEDAVAFLSYANLDDIDVIHASPPCQAYSRARTRWGRDYPQLIEAVRDALIATGKPYVIENVVGAPLHNPLTLCGTMFGLGASGRYLKRHRLFESNIPLAPQGRLCRCKGVPIGGVYGHGYNGPGGRGHQYAADEAREAMGIGWMNRDELTQAIPPAYTHHIGTQLLERIGHATHLQP